MMAKRAQPYPQVQVGAASLANAASLTRTVTVTAPATGTLLNVARADAATVDPDSTNNNGSAPANRVSTVVDERADLVAVGVRGARSASTQLRRLGP